MGDYTLQDKLSIIAGSSMLIFIIIGLVAYVALSIIANWRLFKKAGRPGILSLIPSYHIFVEMKIISGKSWTALLYFVPPIAPVYHIINSIRLVVCYNGTILLGVLAIFFNPIVRMVLAFSEDSVYNGPKTISQTFSKMENEI